MHTKLNAIIDEVINIFGRGYNYNNKRKNDRTLKWWGVPDKKILNAVKLAKLNGIKYIADTSDSHSFKYLSFRIIVPLDFSRKLRSDK